MTRPTQLGRAFPLLTASNIGGTGGTTTTGDDGTFPGSGQVPTSTGSNTWAWASNVALITSNTSNALLGPFVNFQSSTGVTFAVASNTLTISASGSGSGSNLGWFNVLDYGAAGDGATDDTTDINSAIAALNAAGGGVLYFPQGSYLISSALTTITKPCVVRGDGAGGFPYAAGTASKVNQSSATANAFTFSDEGWAIEHIAIDNTNGGTPSAGAGIASATATYARMYDIVVSGFYDCIDLSNGKGWTLADSFIHDPVRYGIRIRGTVGPDDGDQSISGCYFMSDTRDGDAGIRQESAGGLKIVNTKVNIRGVSGGEFVTGIDVAIPTGITTVLLQVANCSVENVTGDGIAISTTGTGSFGHVIINGCEVGLYGNNTGRAVKITAATNGTLSANGSIGSVIIDSCSFMTTGTARAAVELTNTDNVRLGDLVLYGFNARYTSSGDTNTSDGGAGVSYATPAIVLGTAAAAGAASTVIRSDSTIVAFDATVPTTAAFSDSAATGSAAVAARRDHRHGMPAPSGVGELMISDTPAGSPLVFSDILQNEAQDDLLYGDP